MKSACKLDVLTDRIAFQPGLLKAREIELDTKILESPAVLAQKVERHLIKNLLREAPWLIPYIVR